jgi:hypothetical protein
MVVRFGFPFLFALPQEEIKLPCGVYSLGQIC